MAEVDPDGGPPTSEKRDVRERLDVHRPMNVIEGRSWPLVKMAGKKPANVVSYAAPR
ncbi:MAG TPA: hypothetical protein VIH87_00075 [Methylocella sp.]